MAINYCDLTPIRQWENPSPQVFQENILPLHQPAVLRGVAASWPAVKQGKSPEGMTQYLCGLYNDTPMQAMYSNGPVAGRFYYNDTMDGFNFSPRVVQLDQFLKEVLSLVGTANPETRYIGSTPVDSCIPEFVNSNPLDFVPPDTIPRLWVGNRTRVSAHYDAEENIACVISGRRRFTLFPTEQIENLYVGPIEYNPAGQSLSLVDFDQPDYQRYPRFRDALEHAQVAELSAGDALYIPSMWWHHVEGLEELNAMVNYWWRTVPEYLDPPLEALIHAIFLLRHLPEHERNSWRSIFDHYVFQGTGEAEEHIPVHARGLLGELDATLARKLRRRLLYNLQR